MGQSLVLLAVWAASAPAQVPAGRGSPAAADAVVEHCIEWLVAAREEHRAGGGLAPLAVGISAPGPLDAAAGVLIDPPNLHGDWRGFPLAATIAERLSLPWAMERDTNVAILGERDFGAGRGARDLVYLTISTGVGGAVIIDGRLLVGPDGVSGELGHMTVDIDGPMCACGGIGHLEALASGTGIAAAAREALERGQDAPHLASLAAARAPLPLRAIDVTDAAAMGDPVAGVILERARQAVAVAVVPSSTSSAPTWSS